MLETFVNERGIYYVIMVLCVLGAAGKFYESRIYGKLIMAVENPERTEHPFMKQLKLKYKNCYKLEYRVHNIDAFIETSLFKYKERFLDLERLRTVNSRIMLLCILASCVGVAACVYYRVNTRALMYHILAGAMAAAGLELAEQQFGSESKRHILFTTLKDYLENVLSNQLENRTKDKEEVTKQVAVSEVPVAREVKEEGKVPDKKSVKRQEKSPGKSDRELAQEKVIAEVIKEFFP